MANQILFDKLAYVDRLTRTEFAEPQARALAEAMDSALRESVATKHDIEELRTTTKADLAATRTAIEERMIGLEGKIIGLEARMATKDDIIALKSDIIGLKNDGTGPHRAGRSGALRWTVGLIVGIGIVNVATMIALLFAAAHLLMPATAPH